MYQKIYSAVLTISISLILLLTSCSTSSYVVSANLPATAPPTISPVPTKTFTPIPSASPGPASQPATSLPAPLIASATPLPTPEFFDTTEGQPEPWVTVLPEEKIAVPILMYHHIGKTTGSDGRYYVAPDQFRRQMQTLYDMGYETITVTELAAALQLGGSLPARPVVLTFDDGYDDLYLNAFPIMKEYGFIGTMYLVVNNFANMYGVSSQQVLEMYKSGWEVASHSMTHANLRKDSVDLRDEICNSRVELVRLLDIPIYSFAYPYVEADEYIKNFTRDCGYTSGVGAGPTNSHTLEHIYFLSRREVQGNFTLDEFRELLTIYR